DVVAVRDAAVAVGVQVRGRDARQGQVDGPAVAGRIADVAGPVHRADREGVIALAQAAEVGTAAGRVAAAVQAVLQVIDSGAGPVGDRVAAGESEARTLAVGQVRRVAVDARRRLRLVDVDAADGVAGAVAGQVGGRAGHALVGALGQCHRAAGTGHAGKVVADVEADRDVGVVPAVGVGRPVRPAG